ncbi:protein TolR [Marichromatium bheemlicum]|uniref:Tol-Pal system protein TolR n=1 Tax=Marichromatium bheemlicum TaxID=365339 RepID=A0ABX1IEG9_9GAMM|nr:protein TolR [Marichromatium bheemlicum]NKN34545.1 protein TolR [Marichromatium bheemlicum]
MSRRARSRSRRRLVAEINVVPYIDVMLVLLVIFMVTAPMITMGVKVNLPRAQAGAVTSESGDSVVISVDQFGDYYVDLGEEREQAVSEEALFERISKVLNYAPQTPVLVKGDSAVDYGRVVNAMVIAQAAGAAEVGLITLPPEHDGP